MFRGRGILTATQQSNTGNTASGAPSRPIVAGIDPVKAVKLQTTDCPDPRPGEVAAGERGCIAARRLRTSKDNPMHEPRFCVIERAEATAVVLEDLKQPGSRIALTVGSRRQAARFTLGRVFRMMWEPVDAEERSQP
jgi:hypothetical protein